MSKKIPTKKPYGLWNQEQVKLIFEHTKHLSTVATGSLVILVTFMEKFKDFQKWRIMLVISLVGFAISLCASLFAQFGTIDIMEEEQKPSVPTGIGFATSYIGFSVGILCLLMFAVINMVY